jgi:putative glutamine amidotransferase
MALIAITASGLDEAAPYVTSIEKRGGEARVVIPSTYEGVDAALEGVSGLLLCGGVDVHPQFYGAEIDSALTRHTEPARDEMEMALVRAAVAMNMPLLGICRGMQLINVSFGGTLLQDLPGHRAEPNNPPPLKPGDVLKHNVYVSPGSRFGAVIGGGAIFRTNTYHHQGLKEAQRAPGLLASAYSVEDGIIEALESPEHQWVMAVQCHIEKETEVPSIFLKLFDWLVAWSGAFESGEMD